MTEVGVFRLSLGLLSGVVLVGLSACATPSGDSESEQPSESAQQSQALKSFDPCMFFNPDELKSWGRQSVRGEENTDIPWEPTCTWHGENKNITFSKNVEETVESYEQGRPWDSYDKRQVAGRSAAVAQTTDAANSGMGCNVIVNTGGGIVVYQTTVDSTSGLDPCPEIQKVAESTASRLPE